MAINLVKGQLTEIGLSKVGIGLGWDPNEGSTDFDLDTFAFIK
jgi:tellurium resistance protein TerD